MSDLARFRTEIETALRNDGDTGGIAAAVATVGARALPGDGGAVTLMPSDEQRLTLASTDELVDTVEQAQYTVGEGPSLDALTTDRPVLIPDLAATWPRAAWPALTDQLAGLPVAALFAFPMRLGTSPVGIALSYRRRVGELEPDEAAYALRVTGILTLALLEVRELRAAADEDGAWLGDTELVDYQVHQATGMTMVQLGGVTHSAALARLRGHAFAQNQTLKQVAAAVTERVLVFEPDQSPSA